MYVWERELTTVVFADVFSDIGGRFCSDECCLPCPLTELVYSDGEYILLRNASGPS